jgi:hypothetical protein
MILLDQQDEIHSDEDELVEQEVLVDLKICLVVFDEQEDEDNNNLKALILKIYSVDEDLVECEDNNNHIEKHKQNKNQ